MPRLTYFLTCLALSMPAVMAHPGHGNPAAQDGIWHYVTSPTHAGPVVALAILVAMGIAYLQKRKSQR
ncbi:hypothetical protein [Fuerstiella marisgermanici]|uniref:Uncharacterized protein n=1 Tax=Fuerstiella marisgermanici TaxID=1891926 RepID=A0A1P8WHL9_9PLAN|nr:hypothetical protein [Fuerstiella marisgermanici]APZ93556.1 hypothetical protein Fuma_03174 [Fuerstiella marisgermanici]